jgi:hypothetical protein
MFHKYLLLLIKKLVSFVFMLNSIKIKIYFFGGTGVGTQGLVLARQALIT